MTDYDLFKIVKNIGFFFNWGNSNATMDLFDKMYKQSQKLPEHLDNPDEFDKLYDDPFAYLFGTGFMDWWKQKKVNEDLDRWYDDWFKNTGESWKNSPYPWYRYYQREGVGSGSGSLGSLAEEFGVNDAIMRLYRKKW